VTTPNQNLTTRTKPFSPYHLLLTLIGTSELVGAKDNPLIMAMLRQDQSWPTTEEVPWCSAAVNFACKLTDVPRTRDLRARSWLQIGSPVSVEQAVAGFDVVILKRAGDNSPASVIDAPGHVGFYTGKEEDKVLVLGGNQGNTISIARFPVKDILGIRRLQ
jgi:uncharacterized protein (TIGR02594 family)